MVRVMRIDELEIKEKDYLTKLKGTILPFKKYGLIPGIIQALPKYFNDAIPRRNINTQPYCILDYKIENDISIKAKGFYDTNKQLDIDWDVYWQE